VIAARHANKSRAADFTNKAGTQTFRALVVPQKADFWRIVRAHWSNGGPF
jgi:hypothetical protein